MKRVQRSRGAHNATFSLSDSHGYYEDDFSCSDDSAPDEGKGSWFWFCLKESDFIIFSFAPFIHNAHSAQFITKD